MAPSDSPSSNTPLAKENSTEQPKEKDLAETSETNLPEQSQEKRIPAAEIAIGSGIILLFLLVAVMLIKRKKVK